MIDTLDPFVTAFQQESRGAVSIGHAWSAALPTAELGMHSTKEMVGKKGRSARHGMRSRGHQDAGATSMYYILEAIAEVLSTVENVGTPQ